MISELEGKRNHPELGWFARQALRMLDDLRVAHGRLDNPVPIGDSSGTLHVELNHSDLSVLPAGFRRHSDEGPTTTPGSSRSPATSPPTAGTWSWSPRTCRCG